MMGKQLTEKDRNMLLTEGAYHSNVVHSVKPVRNGFKRLSSICFQQLRNT